MAGCCWSIVSAVRAGRQIVDHAGPLHVVFAAPCARVSLNENRSEDISAIAAKLHRIGLVARGLSAELGAGTGVVGGHADQADRVEAVFARGPKEAVSTWRRAECSRSEGSGPASLRAASSMRGALMRAARPA